MKKIIITMITMMAFITVAMAQDAAKDASSEKKKSKSAQEYISDLSSGDEKTVLDAAEWLGNEKEKAAIPALAKILKDDSRVKVRANAAVALGLIGDESSVDALNESLLNDSNADVRYSAILAISRIGSPKSYDALKTAKEKETDPYVKDYIEKMEARFKKK